MLGAARSGDNRTRGVQQRNAIKGQFLNRQLMPDKWVIPLTQLQIAVVDLQDYVYLCKFKWHARKDGNTYYAARRRPRSEYYKDQSLGEFVIMHRVIAGNMDILTEERYEVDHLNGDGLDNRRMNLRAASRAENRVNDRRVGKRRLGGSDYRVRKRKEIVDY